MSPGCGRRSNRPGCTCGRSADSAICGRAWMSEEMSERTTEGMAEEMPRPPSIRRRLLVFLISSLLLMIGGAAIVTYSVAVRSANDAYDRSLLDPAFDIADNVR